jgi:hypothetical protein
MTIPISTVAAVKAHLFDLLTADLTGDNTTSFGVFYGPPGQNQPGYIVTIGDVSDRQVVPFTMVGDGGAGAFREMYHLTVTVSCFHGGQKASDLETTTFGYVAQIESLIRSDMTLGGLVLKAEPSSSSSALAWEENYAGLLAQVDLQIAVLAVI